MTLRRLLLCTILRRHDRRLDGCGVDNGFLDAVLWARTECRRCGRREFHVRKVTVFRPSMDMVRGWAQSLVRGGVPGNLPEEMR